MDLYADCLIAALGIGIGWWCPVSEECFTP